MVEFAEWPLQLIFAVSLALILAASEFGHWLGQRAGERHNENMTTLEASMLGLLALMISFTFAMALTRFDARRDAVLNEANSIGTTAAAGSSAAIAATARTAWPCCATT